MRYYWRNTLGWAFPRLRSGAKSIGSRGRPGTGPQRMTKQTQFPITHFDSATRSADLSGRPTLPFALSVRRPLNPQVFIIVTRVLERCRWTLWFPARLKANCSSPNGDTWRARYSQEGGRKTQETDITLDRLEKKRNKPNFVQSTCNQRLTAIPSCSGVAGSAKAGLPKALRIACFHGSRPNGNNDDETNPNFGKQSSKYRVSNKLAARQRANKRGCGTGPPAPRTDYLLRPGISLHAARAAWNLDGPLSY